MTSSEKTGKTEELDLERDLPLSLKDIAQMRKTRVQEGDLAAYLDFLEEIKALETKGGKRKFYNAVFEL
jgi:hypothetical protein